MYHINEKFLDISRVYYLNLEISSNLVVGSSHDLMIIVLRQKKTKNFCLIGRDKFNRKTHICVDYFPLLELRISLWYPQVVVEYEGSKTTDFVSLEAGS